MNFIDCDIFNVTAFDWPGGGEGGGGGRGGKEGDKGV